MLTNIAANGMGGIGGMVLRITLQNRNLNVVVTNTGYPPETIAHLISYDTTHGKYSLKVGPIENGSQVGDHKVKLAVNHNPENLPWRELDIDTTVDVTGKFDRGDKTIAYIKAGAKRILLTGPSKGGYVQMVVKGVNDNQSGVEAFDIFSNASHITNRIGPVAKVLNNQFGIVNDLITTAHAITNDQKNTDNPHKDLRHARSHNGSIIPTSTGTTKALKEVLPELEGKLHGMALRIPIKSISLADLVVNLEKKVTAKEVNQAFENAGLEGIIEVKRQPLASADFSTSPSSIIIDTKLIMVMSENKVKIIAWYDSEWGYSNKAVGVVEQVGALLTSKEIVGAS